MKDNAFATVLAGASRAIDGLEQRAPKFSMRYLGDPILTQPTNRLVDASDIPKGLLDAMQREMPLLWAECLGLSANQVGAAIRLAYAMLVDDEQTAKNAKSKNPKDWTIARTRVLLINPRIVDASPELVTLVEGCLSIPNFRATIKRHTWVRVDYHDEGFTRKSLRLEGMDAQIIQHEIDHLEGRLITNGVSRQLRRQAECMTARFTAKLRGTK